MQNDTPAFTKMPDLNHYRETLTLTLTLNNSENQAQFCLSSGVFGVGATVSTDDVECVCVHSKNMIHTHT